MKVLLNGKQFIPAASGEKKESAKILALGYSHGAILSRRFANSYAGAVDKLVHLCPAGYSDWGAAGTCCLISNFMLETVNISLRIFSHPGAVFDSSWGVTKGVSGDFFRSAPSCLNGNKSCFKLFRPLTDAGECALYVDDKNYPVARLKNIAAIFAYDDLLFDAEEILGVDDPRKITLQDQERFWSKYYPEEVVQGTKFTFRMLPGTHNGPIEHYTEYAGAALNAAGELGSAGN
jgi:hypothetical protein